MSEQPLALRLADELDDGDYDHTRQTAVELRRLHGLNQELLEALKPYVALHDSDCACNGCAAIAKATGIKQEEA